MKLYDYLLLMDDGEEVTTWDEDYDIETYFFNNTQEKDIDLWDSSMLELSKLLTIKKIHKDGVVVDLSNLIESRLEVLDKAQLFHYCNVDDIMEDIESILAGYVSEKWLETFVNTLKG